MILIIKTKPSHIAAIFIGLAILLTLAGALIGHHQESELKAGVVRAYYGARSLEQRAYDFERRIELIASLTAEGEATHD